MVLLQKVVAFEIGGPCQVVVQSYVTKYVVVVVIVAFSWVDNEAEHMVWSSIKVVGGVRELVLVVIVASRGDKGSYLCPGFLLPCLPPL